ncbi:hypothetical protein [Kineosporia sp. NBRC 101731]|uniref:hypothetical protein n=1 Tax=Kineosporia sp. NBRC 101731 TaxID=3032199 RepID=UPI0024A53B0E|nr:hypothetical protein [Kineosporia sp. NBRC 101731]GLY33076.1 hypothetical protein Kisp02_64410 [Kineosporia sp. NBRC 101731]
MTDEVSTERIRVEVVPWPGGRVRRIHTRGLWATGRPELFIDVPESFRHPAGTDERALVFLLASALVTLAYELLDAEGLDPQPHHDLLGGRPVHLWTASPEPPDEDLAATLGTSPMTVVRVGCSLWPDPADLGEPG